MCKRPRRATAAATDTDTAMRRKQIQIQILIHTHTHSHTHSHTPKQSHLGHAGRCHATCLFTFAALPSSSPPPTTIASCDRAYAACDDDQRVGRELRYSSWPPHTANYAYKMLHLQGVSVCPTVRVCLRWRVSATFGHLTLTTRPATCDLTLAPKLSRCRSRSRRSSGS